jgi:hypothetical protein
MMLLLEILMWGLYALLFVLSLVGVAALYGTAGLIGYHQSK